MNSKLVMTSLQNLYMAIHISVTTCDACAADHVVRYCKRSKTGAGEGLGTRLPLYNDARPINTKKLHFKLLKPYFE